MIALHFLRKRFYRFTSKKMQKRFESVIPYTPPPPLRYTFISFRAGEPEPGVFGSLEPEPLEKKPVAGAAWKKNQEPEPEPQKS